MRLNSLFPNGVLNSPKREFDQNHPGVTEWLHWMIESYPDTIFFFTKETTDIFDDELEVDQPPETVMYVDDKPFGIIDGPKLRVLEDNQILVYIGGKPQVFIKEDMSKPGRFVDPEAAAHSCSCHAKNQGPCELCKQMGCEVWDFNQVAMSPPE